MKWNDVRFLREWLDSNSGEQSTRLLRVLRIMKISEEVGEVTAAVIGVTGQNPRKGVTHSWEDVQAELCDVIIAAMVALDTLNDNAPHVLSKHLASCAERAKLAPGKLFKPGEELLENLCERLNSGATMDGLAEELGVPSSALHWQVSSYRNRKGAIMMRNREGNNTRGRRRSRRHSARNVPADAGETSQHQEDPGGG